VVCFPQVFPPDPTCTVFSPIVAICPFYCFLLNSQFTTAVSHPRPHSSTMYVTTLLSQLLICSPCVHKTLLLIDVYEQYKPLLLHCPPPLLQPTCCNCIKSDLKFASSLAHIFSAPDPQSASTRRPFNASYVVPTG